jgi:SAM-dependent methyltransferase
MSLRKYLLIPQLSLYALRAPRDQGQAWERYWSSVQRTGADGEVLWDADQPAEIETVTAQFRAHADLSLPLVDLGCGNGRQARALAGLFPRVLGIDASPAAVERARHETAGAAGPDGPGGDPGVQFMVADLAEPGWSRQVTAELGEVNAHLRGVLHVVDPGRRAAIVQNLAAVLGTRGTAYISETDLVGDPLDYLVFQGVTATSMPAVVRRLIAAGVRAPSHFGPAQVAEYFPSSRWQVLAQGPTVMHAVPLRAGGPLQQIPSYQAIVRTTGR